MAIRTDHPAGVPCWLDLWTSDVEGSRRFYGDLFGWTADEPNPAFGGYFNFRLGDTLVAGAMGDTGSPGDDFQLAADDTWTAYLATDDIEATVAAARAAGAEIRGDCHEVGDLGFQARLDDPTGAHLGLWQAGTHAGFTVLDEPGAPTWFELHTRDHDGAVAFYRDVFGIATETVSETDEFRYTTLVGPSDCGQVAGIMNASAWLGDEVGAHWTVYFSVADVDASVALVESRGGTVCQPAEDTPYGRIATVADPAGAVFHLRTPPGT